MRMDKITIAVTVMTDLLDRHANYPGVDPVCISLGCKLPPSAGLG